MALETGALGDAAETWAGYLARQPAIDHLGDAAWVVDEPGTWPRPPVRSGRRRTSGGPS
ncbi:MAG: hypothetical protein R3C32_13235 [Chloroflexota bacterium]